MKIFDRTIYGLWYSGDRRLVGFLYKNEHVMLFMIFFQGSIFKCLFYKLSYKEIISNKSSINCILLWLCHFFNHMLFRWVNCPACLSVTYSDMVLKIINYGISIMIFNLYRTKVWGFPSLNRNSQWVYGAFKGV